MIVEYHLSVLFGFNFNTSRIITRVRLWVDIDNFTVSFVLEKKALGTIRDDLIVRSGV